MVAELAVTEVKTGLAVPEKPVSTRLIRHSTDEKYCIDILFIMTPSPQNENDFYPEIKSKLTQKTPFGEYFQFINENYYRHAIFQLTKQNVKMFRIGFS